MRCTVQRCPKVGKQVVSCETRETDKAIVVGICLSKQLCSFNQVRVVVSLVRQKILMFSFFGQTRMFLKPCRISEPRL